LKRLGVLLLWPALFSAVALAAPESGKKAELQEQQGALRGRIQSLSKDLAKKEESRADAAEQLREAESAISGVNRRLRELSNDRSELEGELADLTLQGTRLDRQTATQQAQLAKLLHHQFVSGDSDALQLLLAGRDPNQAARDRYFLTELSRAKADLIRELRGVAAEKKRLAESVRERQGKLAEIEKRQQDSRALLVEKQKQRQAMLTKLAGQIKSQRAEIGALKRDEQRLSTLITQLAQQAVKRKQAKSALRYAPDGGDHHRPPRREPVKNADPRRGRLLRPCAASCAAGGRSDRGPLRLAARRRRNPLARRLHPRRRRSRSQDRCRRYGGLLGLDARFRQSADRRPRRRLSLDLRQQSDPAARRRAGRQIRRNRRHRRQHRWQPGVGFIL
jgi:septal ring factor EnvC (AmiA/AmiB activator)